MLSSAARVASRRVASRATTTTRRALSEAKKEGSSQSVFTLSPLTSSIVLIGVTGAIGVFMYYQDEELPQKKPSGAAAAEKK